MVWELLHCKHAYFRDQRLRTKHFQESKGTGLQINPSGSSQSHGYEAAPSQVFKYGWIIYPL
jgi:hypothetical protein